MAPCVLNVMIYSPKLIVSSCGQYLIRFSNLFANQVPIKTNDVPIISCMRLFLMGNIGTLTS